MNGWLLGAVAALLVALASAWVIHLFGPKKKDQKRYQPPDLKQLDKLFKQARRDGAPAALQGLMRESVELAYFTRWILTEGTTNQDYTRKIRGVTWRLTPYANYKDESGRTCRKLYSQKRVQEHWKGTEETYCLVEGQWRPMAVVPRGKGAASNPSSAA